MSPQEFSTTMEESEPQVEEIQNSDLNSQTLSPLKNEKEEDGELSEQQNSNHIPNHTNNNDGHAGFGCFDCHAKLECPKCRPHEFLAPGFRFKPFDDELIVHYLRRKVRKQPLPHNNLIRDVELYKHNPENLTGIV